MPPRTMESITQDYEALMQLIDEAGGDITGAEEALDKWFEQIEGAVEDKTDAYVSVMRELEARAEWRKAEAKRLTDKAKRDEKNVAGIKGRLLCYMQRLNKTTIETPRNRVTVAKAGTRSLTLIGEPTGEYVTHIPATTEPNKKAITEALKAGTVLDFARLEPPTEYLRIT